MGVVEVGGAERLAPEALLAVVGSAGRYQRKLLLFCCLLGALAGVVGHAYEYVFWLPDFWPRAYILPPLALQQLDRLMRDPDNAARVAARVSVITEHRAWETLHKHYDRASSLLLISSTLATALLPAFGLVVGRRSGHALALLLCLAAAAGALRTRGMYATAALLSAMLLGAGLLLPSALHAMWESSGGALRQRAPSLAYLSCALAALGLALAGDRLRGYRHIYALAAGLAVVGLACLCALVDAPGWPLRAANFPKLRDALTYISRQNHGSTEHNAVAERVANLCAEAARAGPRAVGPAPWARLLGRFAGAVFLNAHLGAVYLLLCVTRQAHKGEGSAIALRWVLLVEATAFALMATVAPRLRRKAVNACVAAALAALAGGLLLVARLDPHLSARRVWWEEFTLLLMRGLVCMNLAVSFNYTMELLPARARGWALVLSMVGARLLPWGAALLTLRLNLRASAFFSFLPVSSAAFVVALLLPETLSH